MVKDTVQSPAQAVVFHMGRKGSLITELDPFLLTCVNGRGMCMCASGLFLGIYISISPFMKICELREKENFTDSDLII